jgi:hypothetical protein
MESAKGVAGSYSIVPVLEYIFGRRNNNFETKICNYIKFIHGYHSADLLRHGLGWRTATLSLGIAVSRKMIILSVSLSFSLL